MKKSIRKLSLLLSLIFLMYCTQIFAAPLEGGGNSIADGAEIRKYTDIGSVDNKGNSPPLDFMGFPVLNNEIPGSEVYVYVPATMNPVGVQTPMVLLYGNEGYENETEAEQALISSGIIGIAEEEGFPVYLPNPVGETWSETDYSVYVKLAETTHSDNAAMGGYGLGGDKRMSYFIGEGAGADFINKYMSKSPQASGVLVFNSTFVPEDNDVATPAVVVNGSSQVIDYYKQTNGTDIEAWESGLMFYRNSDMPLKQVITASSSTQNGYDPQYVQLAWERAFSKTRKINVDAQGEWPLLEEINLIYPRPDYEELGIQVNAHVGEKINPGDANTHEWYEFIPESVTDSVYGEVPLVLMFHGGGNAALYMAEASGWPVLGAEEGFITVAIQHDGRSPETPELVISLLDHLMEELPVDSARVYATGFSMGSIMSFNVGTVYPERFAAIAPMDGAFPPLEGVNDQLKIPTFYTAGKNEILPAFPHQSGSANNVDLMLNQIKTMNEIPVTEHDAEKGLWGVELEDETTTDAYGGLAVNIGKLYNPIDGIPYMAFNAVDGQNHAVYRPNSQYAWQFIKQFSRNAEGSLEYENTFDPLPPQWTDNSSIAVSGRTTTSVSLEWSAAADNKAVTGYRIYCQGEKIKSVGESVYSTDITGLSAGTKYYFTVEAGDAAGNWSMDGPQVTAYTRSSSSGGGDSSSSMVTKPEPEDTANTVISNSDGSVTLSVKAQLAAGTNRAKVSLTKDEVEAALTKTQQNVDGQQKLVVDVGEVSGANTYSVEVPRSILNSGLSTSIAIRTVLGTVEVPGNMLDGIEANGSDNVSVNIGTADRSKISTDVLREIGQRPVVELTLSDGDSTMQWNNPNAPVTVSIPYVPTQEELANPEHIVVWYIDGQGNANPVYNGRYNTETGMVTFETTHFSSFAVAYVDKSFQDLGTHAWAKKQVEVLASKGIINGTSKISFSPGANITRADYLVLLVRTLGLSAEAGLNFSDVMPGSYYYQEVGAAKQLGITTGAGNNMFKPNDPISRQDMMVLTERALRIAGVLTERGKASDLQRFTDSQSISDYAENSIAALVRERLISGSGSRISPDNNTSRAEAAVLLYRIYNY